MFAGDRFKHRPDPRLEPLLLRRRRLRLFLGRHLVVGKLLGHILPDFGVALHLVDRSEHFEIEVALLFLGRMTPETELLQDRPDLSFEHRRLGRRPRRRRGRREERREHDDQKHPRCACLRNAQTKMKTADGADDADNQTPTAFQRIKK